MEDSKKSRIKETIASIIKSLECVICLDVLDDPVSTGCHHYFCRNCIKKVLSTNYRAPCPLCKYSFTKRSLQERPQLVLITSCAKNLAEAYKKDTGLEVSPPKGPRISATSPASRNWKERLFNICHPSPLKPLNKKKSVPIKAPNVCPKRKKKQLPKNEKFCRLESASEGPAEKPPSTEMQSTSGNKSALPSACPGSSHAAEFRSITDSTSDCIPTTSASYNNQDDVINQNSLASTVKESSVFEAKAKSHVQDLPCNPQAQEDSDSEVETVAKIEKFLESSLKEMENKPVPAEQNDTVHKKFLGSSPKEVENEVVTVEQNVAVDTNDEDLPVTSTPDMNVNSVAPEPRIEMLTNVLSPVKIQDSSTLPCHTEDKYFVEAEMPQLDHQFLPSDNEEKFKSLRSNEDETDSEKDPYVFIPSQKSIRKKIELHKRRKAIKAYTRHVLGQHQRPSLSEYTQKVLQNSKTEETDRERDPYVFVPSQKSPLKIKIRKRLVERIKKAQSAKLKLNKKSFDKKVESLYTAGRKRPCSPKLQKALVAKKATHPVNEHTMHNHIFENGGESYTDDNDISLFVTPAFSIEDLPNRKSASPEKKKARIKWVGKPSTEKRRKSGNAVNNRSHNDEVFELNAKIAEAEIFELEMAENCGKNIVQDKCGGENMVQTDRKTGYEAARADRIRAVRRKTCEALVSNDVLVKDGRNNQIPKHNIQLNQQVSAKTNTSENRALRAESPSAGENDPKTLATSASIKPKEALFSAAPAARCKSVVKDLVCPRKLATNNIIVSGMSPKNKVDLSRTHYMPSQTSVSIFGSSEAKRNGNSTMKMVEKGEGLNFDKESLPSSVSEVAETPVFVFCKAVDNHVAKKKTVQQLVSKRNGKEGADLVSSRVEETPMNATTAPMPICIEDNANSMDRSEDRVETAVLTVATKAANRSKPEQSCPLITGGNREVAFSNKLSPEKGINAKDIEETYMCPGTEVKITCNEVNLHQSTKKVDNVAGTVVEDKSSEELCLEDIEKFFKKSSRKTFALDVESQDLDDLTGEKSRSTMDMLDTLYSEQKGCNRSNANQNANQLTPGVSNNTPSERSNNFDVSDGTLLVSTREANVLCETPLNFAQNCLPTPDTSMKKDVADQTSEVDSLLHEKAKVVKRVCLTLEEIRAYFEKSEQSEKSEVICVIPSPSNEFRIELSVSDQTFNVSVLKVTNNNQSTPSGVKTSCPPSHGLPTSSFMQRLNELTEACTPSKINMDTTSKHVAPVPLESSEGNSVQSCSNPKSHSETLRVPECEKSNDSNPQMCETGGGSQGSQSVILKNNTDIRHSGPPAVESVLPQTNDFPFLSCSPADSFAKDDNAAQVEKTLFHDKTQQAGDQAEETVNNVKQTVAYTDVAFENTGCQENVNEVLNEVKETLSIPNLGIKEGMMSQETGKEDFRDVIKNDVWVRACATTFEASEHESKLRKAEDRDSNIFVNSSLAECIDLSDDSSSSDASDPCIYRPKSLNATRVTLAEPMKDSESFSSDPDMIFAESLVAPLKEIAEKMNESKPSGSANKSMFYSSQSSFPKKLSNSQSSAKKHNMSGRQSKLEELLVVPRKSQNSARKPCGTVTVRDSKADGLTCRKGKQFKRIKAVTLSDDSDDDDDYSLSLFQRTQLRKQSGNAHTKNTEVKEIPDTVSDLQCVEPDSQTDPSALRNTEDLGLTNDVSSSCPWSCEEPPSSQARGKMKIEIEEMKERIKMMEEQINKSVTDDSVLKNGVVDRQDVEGASNSEKKSTEKVKCKNMNALYDSKRPHESSSEDSDDLFNDPVSPTPPRKHTTRTTYSVWP